MTVRDSTTLKSYFNLANVLTPSNYVDLIDTLFAQGNDGVYGEHNHDDRYVQLSIANTIFAVHSFTPSTYGPPFILGSNAQGQTVVGLKADQLNKSISVSGLGLSGGGALTVDQTITLTSSNNPTNAQILASDSNGYLTLMRLQTDTITDKTGGGASLTLLPSGNIILDPTGLNVLPNLGYEINLGSLQKKYLTLHAAELWVETLVAQNTIATIGGRILVGPTTVFVQDLASTIGITDLFSTINPGFETAGGGGVDVFANWTEAAGTGTIERDLVVFHTGIASAKLNTIVPTTPPHMINTVTVTPLTVYSITFWTKGDGVNAGRYGIYDVTHSSWIVAVITTGITSTTWTEITADIFVPDGCVSIFLDLYGPLNAGYCYFDDCKFKDTAWVTVKHNQMVIGDVVYSEANMKVEFFRVIAGPSGSDGAYIYAILRNLDGTGANDWYQGDALFNTTGGFIDLYSLRGVKQASELTNYGPTIVGNVRNSLIYNDWSEHWAFGNLNRLYGYGVTTYGFAAGKYATGIASSFITADTANGFRVRTRSAAGVDITRFQISMAGVLTVNDGSGVAVITLDSTTGAEITKKLTMPGVDSAISIGATPPTSATVGTGIWIDRTGMYGLLSSVLQAKFDSTTGAITAGAGNLKLDVSGLVFVSGRDTDAKMIRWMEGSDSILRIGSGIISSTERGAWIEMPITLSAGGITQVYFYTGIDPTNGPNITFQKFYTGAGYIALNASTAAQIVIGSDDTVSFHAALYKYSDATPYTTVLFHPLESPGTSTSWDGDSKTTGDRGSIPMLSTFGVPITAKAVLIRLEITDNTPGAYVALGPSASYAACNIAVVQVANVPVSHTAPVPCDANGNIYFYNSETINNVKIEVWGYWL